MQQKVLFITLDAGISSENLITISSDILTYKHWVGFTKNSMIYCYLAEF